MDSTASSENFYSSPQTVTLPSVRSSAVVRDQPNRMPVSVKLAIASGVVCIGLSVFGQFSIYAFGSDDAHSKLFFIFGLALLLGLVRAMRTAYRLVRILSCLAAIRYGLTFAIGICVDPRLYGEYAQVQMGYAPGMTVREVYAIQYAFLLCLVLGLVTVYVSLRRPSARQFFRLDCETCGRAKPRVFSLLDKDVECERCRAA